MLEVKVQSTSLILWGKTTFWFPINDLDRVKFNNFEEQFNVYWIMAKCMFIGYCEQRNIHTTRSLYAPISVSVYLHIIRVYESKHSTCAPFVAWTISQRYSNYSHSFSSIIGLMEISVALMTAYCCIVMFLWSTLYAQFNVAFAISYRQDEWISLDCLWKTARRRPTSSYDVLGFPSAMLFQDKASLFKFLLPCM